MPASAAWPPILAVATSRTLAAAMAVGLAGVFVLLAVLVWTRFGQARPLSKCIFLSLLAHLLLLIYAYSTHILFGPPGSWMGRTVMVRIHDAADWEETATVAAADPQPWEQAGDPDGPLADSAAESSPPPAPAEAAAPTNAPAPEPPAEPPPPVPMPEQAQARQSAPTAPPTAGLASSEPSPQPEMPRLTDLLPDDEGPTETPPTESATAKSTPPAVPAENPAVPSVASDSGGGQFVATTPLPPRRLGDGQNVPEPLQARVASDRLKAAQPFGATPQTEAAVAAALDWLASAQSGDGRWDADAHGGGRETRRVLGHDRMGHDRQGAGARADTGVSGLALLAFLGSGETHLAGPHRETVQRGLEFLLASQARDGSLAGNAEFFAAMYCHGMATLALSEAYALSGDERLLPGLSRALQYTTYAQHARGGWRYQPYDEGDMSQFGWQLMALKSAELGGIPLPEATRTKMVRFLASCSAGASRGLASYRPGDRVSRPMTAEALVCRCFLKAENAPAAIEEAVEYLLEERPGAGQRNYYYWYYGTLGLFQKQGSTWERWNKALQNELLPRQRWDGSAAGSWDPDDVWGGYGGRVYSTALAALSLEVYYRYLPLHGREADSRFSDRPWLPDAVPR